MKAKLIEKESNSNMADSMVSVFQTGEDQLEWQKQSATELTE